MLAQQAWDYVLFRWDRYVLTFGLYDQLRILGGLRDAWQDLMRRLGRHDDPMSAAPDSAPAAPVEPGQVVEPPKSLPDVPLPFAVGLTLCAALAWWLYLRLRPPLTATAAYARLRKRLRRKASLSDSTPPLLLGREAASRFPGAAEPAARVIDFYLRESFGGQVLGDEERTALRTALGQAEKNMRKAG